MKILKNYFERITGIAAERERIREASEQIEQERKRIEDEERKRLAEIEREQAELRDKRAQEELLKVDPKTYYTDRKEPWISVLDVKVNEENVRNGFFEMDWNRYFVEDLIRAGYGTIADPEEEVVDRWFKDIVLNMLQDEGLDTDRGAGYINVVPISKGKSEVS